MNTWSLLPSAKVHDVREAIVHPEVVNGIDKRVWPIAASTMLMGTAIGVVLPVMPLFARDLGLTYVILE